MNHVFPFAARLHALSVYAEWVLVLAFSDGLLLIRHESGALSTCLPEDIMESRANYLWPLEDGS